jgi:hypothetical protein
MLSAWKADVRPPWMLPLLLLPQRLLLLIMAARRDAD